MFLAVIYSLATKYETRVFDDSLVVHVDQWRGATTELKALVWLVYYKGNCCAAQSLLVSKWNISLA